MDAATRSRMMSGIRGRNTKPEIIIRRALHLRGFRYRLHVKRLPGKPDLVLKKYNAVVFIHGCFWHGHHCRFFKIPKTRTDFWMDKIERNKLRDKAQVISLIALGWRVSVVWECAVKTMVRDGSCTLVDKLSQWLVGDGEFIELDVSE